MQHAGGKKGMLRNDTKTLTQAKILTQTSTAVLNLD